MYKLYKYTIFIVMWILVITGFIYKDSIPSWIFIATWCLVNAIEEMLDNKIEKLLKEKQYEDCK